MVDVFDAGLHGSVPYIVLELLEGETLATWLARQPSLQATEAIRIARDALLGVQAAHDAGIIHRDLKPDNIFLVTSKDGTPPCVKVLDFGISKVTSDALAETNAGTVLGTPYYMAPEQVRGDVDVDARCDVYAMGVVLYELLVGEPPFIASSYAALVHDIIHRPFPAPRSRNASVPESVDAAVRRAAERSREARFATARDFYDALAL